MDSFSTKSQHSRATSRHHILLLPHNPHSMAGSSHPSHTMTLPATRKIPADKLDEAVELYSKYLAAARAEDLEECNALEHGHHLHPSTSQARSTTSRRSSKRPKVESGSVSECDGMSMSDISSVVDFGGDKKPSKALSVSYKGKVVKQTRRSAFTPAKKLKTHLTRLLGCCTECAVKKIPCPLSHQDIGTLQRIIDERRDALRSQEPDSSGSSTTNSSQQTARSTTGRHSNESTFSQDDFMHMGAQLPSSTGLSGNMHHDLQSPGGDLLSDVAPGIVITDFHFRPLDPDRGTKLYVDHGHGSIILIGVQENGYVYCQHRAGCQQQFLDAESLQIHFQYDHFDFTRITPAVKHVCLDCKKENAGAYLRCQWCFVHDNIQSQIHGHFIRPLDTSFSPDDSPAPLQNYSSSPFYPAYATSVNNAETGPSYGPDNGLNLDSFFDYTHANQYGGQNFQGYGNNNNSYNDTTMGDSPYQGDYTGARQVAIKQSVHVRVLFLNIKRHSQKLKHLLLLAIVLIILTLFFAHDQIISKAHSTLLQAGPEIREHLPTIGFIILFLSFGASFLVKHRARSTIHSHSCTALRAFSPLANRYTTISPHTNRCPGLE